MRVRRLKEFPDYGISRDGRVYKFSKKKLISASANSQGYLLVSLYLEGRWYTKRLHRILAQVYLPNPLHKPFVDHIDRNKLNNSLENLRWVTPLENSQNQSLYSTNRSGVKGVCFRQKTGKYRMTITCNGIRKEFQFDTKKDAAFARKQGEMSFHKFI